MNLHHRALEGFASPERHTFKIVNIYTGRNYKAQLVRETKCYYVLWVTGLVMGDKVLERRFHKATMCIDELCLYIGDKAEEQAQAEKEIAAKVAYADELNQADTAEVIPTDEQLTAAVDKVFSTPDLQDAPTFCPVCESYAKHDEMIFNPHAATVVCIDCDDELDTQHRVVIETIKSVAVMNYNGGHLAGFNFTPTLRHLPRMLVAYTPNTGQIDSPNELIQRLGYSCVNASRDNAVRVIYDDTGAYVVHGGFNEIEAALIAIANGE